MARPDVIAEQLVMRRVEAMAVASVGGADKVLAAFNEAWTGLIDRSR